MVYLLSIVTYNGDRDFDYSNKVHSYRPRTPGRIYNSILYCIYYIIINIMHEGSIRKKG